MHHIFCVLLATFCLGYAQQCGTANPFTLYLAPPPSPYNGVVSIGPDMGDCQLQSPPPDLLCTVSDVLGDGTTTPGEATNLSNPDYLTNFVVWSSSISRHYVVFQLFRSPRNVSGVDLYFLNYPAENIGLPILELFRVSRLGVTSGGTRIPYTLTNNQDLDSDDSRVRRVTLLFNGRTITQQHIRMDMSFSDLHNTNWFFLSEIRFCNLSPQVFPSDTIQFQTPQTASTMVEATPKDLSSRFIELTCMVSNQGSFEWQWKKEGATSPLENGDKFTVTTAFGSRTSVLTISELEAADNGTYQCRVNHVGNTATVQTRSFVLTLSDDVPTPKNIYYNMFSTADAEPAGTHDIAGSLSSTSDSTGLIVTTTVQSTSIATSPDNTATIVAVVVVLVLLFLAALIATIIIIIVLYVRWRKRSHYYDDTRVDRQKQNGDSTIEHSSRRLTKEDINWQLSSQKEESPPPPDQVYAMVNKTKEPAPPIPPQNFATSDVDALKASYGDQYYSNVGGNISPSGSPKLKKVSKKSKYELSANPIHESPDQGLDEGPDMALYAMPDKNVFSNKVEEISEPIYSEPLDPNLFHQDQGIYQNDLHPYGSIYAEPERFNKEDAPLEITPERIREVKVLGLGQFGEVALATTVGLSLKDLKLSADDNDRGVQIQVAVKKLKPQAEKQIFLNFQKEIKFMARLRDDNIVRLLAVCNGDNPFIVMEYMENGDLNQFLRKHSLALSETSIGADQLPVSILVYMIVQIASGMRYLASLKYVHRDMATRNCLIGKDFVIKIADFGMSRSLYESSYYRIRGRAMLPIRWMATESFYGQFSEKTNVWAFGITMWEIFVLCKKQPFENLDDQAMIQDAIQGTGRQLPSKPDACPMNVYRVMLRCCEYAPEDRATFDEIFKSLAAIHRKM